MWELSVSEIIYLFSAFHGLFLITLLCTKVSKNKANIFLIILIGLFSFYLFENVIYLSGYLKSVPHFFLSSLPLIYLKGPLFYHYIRLNVSEKLTFKTRHLLHLTPFVFELIILLPFYLLSAQIKAIIYENSLIKDQPGEWNIYFFGFLVYIASTFWFVYLAFIQLNKRTFKGKKQRLKSLWLKRFSIFFLVYVVISVTLAILSRLDVNVWSYSLHFNLIGQVIIIHSIGYIAFIYPEMLLNNEKRDARYEFSSLDKARIASLKGELEKMMHHNKPFLNHELSPEYFTEQLGISKGNFSQLLSEGMKTNFYDFVNHYRVEEAKRLLARDEYAKAKILHIAFDSGFSNKSSFLRNFKKINGCTPSEFRKELSDEAKIF